MKAEMTVHLERWRATTKVPDYNYASSSVQFNEDLHREVGHLPWTTDLVLFTIPTPAGDL
jgi:hypothetical protein